jgi:hypothetical protein
MAEVPRQALVMLDRGGTGSDPLSAHTIAHLRSVWDSVTGLLSGAGSAITPRSMRRGLVGVGSLVVV